MKLTTIAAALLFAATVHASPAAKKATPAHTDATAAAHAGMEQAPVTEATPVLGLGADTYLLNIDRPISKNLGPHAS